MGLKKFGKFDRFLGIGLESLAYLNLAFFLGFTLLPVRAGSLANSCFDLLYASSKFMAEFAVMSSLLLFFWVQLGYLFLTWKKMGRFLKWRQAIALVVTLTVGLLGFPLWIGLFVKLP